MNAITLDSHEVSAIRNALYDSAKDYFELQARASSFERAQEYQREGNRLYALAEKLKPVNQLEGK